MEWESQSKELSVHELSVHSTTEAIRRHPLDARTLWPISALAIGPLYYTFGQSSIFL